MGWRYRYNAIINGIGYFTPTYALYKSSCCDLSRTGRSSDAVGAAGVPVKVGSANGAFKAKPSGTALDWAERYRPRSPALMALANP